MNRREFCLTAGLLATTSFFGNVVALPIEERSHDHSALFRAKKVFPESWASEIDGVDSLQTGALVRKRLNYIRREGCDALILAPNQRSFLTLENMIETEATRLGLSVFVPTRITRDFLSEARTAVPLVCEKGIMQCLDGRATDDGGFLLTNGSDNIFGIVLYDSSRCLWTGFVSTGISPVRRGNGSESDSKLIAARWIDLTRQSWSPLSRVSALSPFTV